MKAEKLKMNYYIVSAILLGIVVVIRVLYIYMLHYPLSTLRPKDTNIWFEIVRMMLPIVTWVIACYAITSIIDGESSLPEIFGASAYSMTPYILLIIPLALLSKVMGQDDAGLYNFLYIIIWVWVFLLYFISVRELNDYTIIKSALICILNIISMLLIWAICILFLSLTSQLYTFIQGFILEIKLIFS